MSSEHITRCDFERSQLILRLDLTFQADIPAITPVVDRVMNVAGEMSCARGKEFEVEVSLREALVNAVKHGCGNDPNKSVQVTVCCDESRGMLIIVRDPGPGFDLDSLPSPLIGENVFASHGRGIFLINQLMDEVRVSGQGTEIHMVKR
jgi:serine/threonine-protein kinase RsbW